MNAVVALVGGRLDRQYVTSFIDDGLPTSGLVFEFDNTDANGAGIPKLEQTIY